MGCTAILIASLDLPYLLFFIYYYSIIYFIIIIIYYYSHRTHQVIFIEILNFLFYKQSLENVILLINTPQMVRLNPLLPEECNEPTPVFLILNI